MKAVLALIVAAALSGCALTDGFVKKEVVVQNVYVVRKATDQQKALPPMPDAIDPATADQTALALWIAQTEKRMLDLESIIKNLITFYEKPATEEEKKKAPAPADAASAPAK